MPCLRLHFLQVGDLQGTESTLVVPWWLLHSAGGYDEDMPLLSDRDLFRRMSAIGPKLVFSDRQPNWGTTEG